MNRLLTVSMIVLLALLLGVGSALVSLRQISQLRSVQNGPWSMNPDTGGPTAGLYHRAHVAMVGLFALKNTEAVYFLANTDEQGRTLRAACDYSVAGRAPRADWWSLTLYNGDYMLIDNERDQYSYDRNTLELDSNERFTIRIQSRPVATEDPGNTIAAGNAAELNLLLRLYFPDSVYLQSPDQVELPSIRRGDCR